MKRWQIIRRDEGKKFGLPLGNRAEVKADASAGMGLGFFRSVLPPGAGMPFMHRHAHCDEAFYVVEGELEYTLDGETVRAGAGAAVLIPAGTAHCFHAVGESPATVVVMSSGADGVDMVAELAAQGTMDRERMRAVLARYDSELVEPVKASA